jgi:hypothetical protein
MAEPHTDVNSEANLLMFLDSEDGDWNVRRFQSSGLCQRTLAHRTSCHILGIRSYVRCRVYG